MKNILKKNVRKISLKKEIYGKYPEKGKFMENFLKKGNLWKISLKKKIYVKLL